MHILTAQYTQATQCKFQCRTFSMHLCFVVIHSSIDLSTSFHCKEIFDYTIKHISCGGSFVLYQFYLCHLVLLYFCRTCLSSQRIQT